MARGMRVGGVLLSFLVIVPVVRAAEEDPVNKAISRGVAALKRIQDDKPDDPLNRKGRAGRMHQTGAPALVGLTLLECGVPAEDKLVKKIAEQLRKECIELNHTYSLALSIMFLDKLGDPGDLALIQSMGVRLLSGQGNTGGWSYTCEAPSKAEVRRLTDLMADRNSPGIQQPVKQEDSLFKAPPLLPKELKDEVDRIQKRKPDKGDKDDGLRGLVGGGDNSNTQFAILGLWVAGRHGVPIDKAMAKVDTRFRASQNGDGGWSYSPVFSNVRGGDTSSGAMTCAGLLGLAMSHGAANQAVLRTDPKTPPNKLPRDPARDPAVLAGLRALGTSIGQPVDPRKKGVARVIGLQKGYYFLWSIERVAVAFNLQTIGNKDWYAWGSQLLIASQDADGAWQGEYGYEIDTCFALLFLRRVNLAKDLTASIRGLKDPGEVKLTAGGVGGEDLIAKGLVSGIVLKDHVDIAGDEAAKLSDELVRASVPQQGVLITKLKEGKGTVYTDALAASIPQLTGGTRTQARDALAERLARMKAGTLRDKLQDEAAEIRRAAAVACYMKDEKSLTPELIDLLEDKDGSVSRTAQAVLKEMTKKDFGPAAGATADQRLEAVTAWKDWWRNRVEVSSLHDWLHQAESGDLRPQVNPQAIVDKVDALTDERLRSPVVRALLQRFFALSRPIGDACRGPRPDLRLQDAGPFFYLVESLTRLDCAELEDTLLILLDEFAQLEERSYDELYLWSIVHLSRTDPRHVETFWPMVVALDLRYRSEPWQRPEDVPLFEQPYRMTELLFYFYTLYTLKRGPHGDRTTPSLARCLQRAVERMSTEQRRFVIETLEALVTAQRHPDFGDAHGLLMKAP